MQKTQQVKLSKFDQLKLIYGEEIAKKIQSASLLVVGAGGIGCELVKSLSLSGFTKISIIDLDTIDISNLNRQFLFRREHVDQPKSTTLKLQIEKQNPNMKIEAFLGRIQEDRFGYKFFKQFDLVVNALDNEEARKHVNHMCFNLNKPLVDAGTNGYEMTCLSIKKGVTPCYQCVDRKKDQTFPVCTIRQKPEKTIHCIVWAKALFEGLYGSKEAATQNIIEDIIEDLEKARLKSDETKNHTEFAQILIDKLFGLEPENLQKTLTERSKMEECDKDEKESILEFVGKIKPHYFKDFKSNMEVSVEEKKESDQEAQTTVQPLISQIQKFISVITTIHTDRAKQIGSMIFDKDDSHAVEFVTTAANIRADNFSIPMESLFKIKEMAGKIVPAISSSNALGASLQVFEVIKLLSGQDAKLKGIVYQRTNDKVRLNSLSRANEAVNSECQICSEDTQTIVVSEIKDFATFKLQDLKQKILIDSEVVGLSGKTISITQESKILYEYDQEMIDDNDPDDAAEIKMNAGRLDKTLIDLKVAPQSCLQVQGLLKSATDSTESSILLQLFENKNLTEEFQVELIKKGQAPKPKASAEETKADSTPKPVKDSKVDISSDECEELDDKQIPKQKLPKKRTSPETTSTEKNKRQKQEV